MKKASRIVRSVLGLAIVGILVACGGGSATDVVDDVDQTSGAGEATVITVGDIPGANDACEKVVNMIGAMGQVMGGQISTEAARSIVDDFVAAVPQEIRADADVLVSAFTGYIDVLSKYDGDMAAAMADPEAITALERIGDAETSASTERINTYLADECGLAG
jgi:hypothetical protein